MNTFKICEKRKEILKCTDHILIEGGPGSGKTTIALLKAIEIIQFNSLKANQKILFLSFARATISRVEEQAKNLISKADKKLLEINTYHGFSWSIIKAYGYLLKPIKCFNLITPPNIAALISSIPLEEREFFKRKLLNEKGIICFDLFSETASLLLRKSEKICSIIAGAYPYIIVDEFQDTDSNEWEIIKLLGKHSKIIALADLNQRIYEFRGASITRIPEFNAYFMGARVDFGLENNRSANTDIVQFGDDLLLGENRGKQYKNVVVNRYPYYKETRSPLKYALINSINRLKKVNNAWSIAVLVKSRQDTLLISSYLSSQNLNHDVLIDPAGPSLSAAIIAQLMQPSVDPIVTEKALISNLINHLKGRKGDKIAKKDLESAKFLGNYLQDYKINGSNRKVLINEIKELISRKNALNWKGIPEDDWLAVRNLFQVSKHELLNNVFEDAKYLRLLNKGAILSEKLSEVWRNYGEYKNAGQAIEEALMQEHFSMSHRIYSGIIVMNIHKSKGKEFDEVIIWEDLYKPIVYPNSNASRLQQDRLVLRVAVTRSKSLTTFMTPASNPCIFL